VENGYSEKHLIEHRLNEQNHLSRRRLNIFSLLTLKKYIKWLQITQKV